MRPITLSATTSKLHKINPASTSCSELQIRQMILVMKVQNIGQLSRRLQDKDGITAGISLIRELCVYVRSGSTNRT
jgi:hypothetical protein